MVCTYYKHNIHIPSLKGVQKPYVVNFVVHNWVIVANSLFTQNNLPSTVSSICLLVTFCFPETIPRYQRFREWKRSVRVWLRILAPAVGRVVCLHLTDEDKAGGVHREDVTCSYHKAAKPEPCPRTEGCTSAGRPPAPGSTDAWWIQWQRCERALWRDRTRARLQRTDPYRVNLMREDEIKKHQRVKTA